MNTISNSSIIKLKINADEICRFDNSVSLSHPREDNEGNYYVCSHAGDIMKFNEYGNSQVLLTIGGQPHCITFDSSDSYYYTDIANAAIFFNAQTGNENELDSHKIVRKDYEGVPFKGPTSIAYNKEEDVIVYCDAGNFGSSSLNRPNGSLYVDDIQNNLLRPLLLNCLSNPSDIAIDSSRGIIYVCETFTNRILRITQGVNQTLASVFYQFSGRVGPTAIALDDSSSGNIYIARYEVKTSDEVDGLISVISREGNLIGELIIPKYPEITGLLLPSKNKEIIYFTEKNTSAVMGIKLNSFINQLSSYEDSNKVLY